MGRVGIRELAAEVGLSVSTVSRAMNARGDVSPATVDVVRAAAERLGYRPNQSGRTLRRGATGTVALVIQTNTARTQMGETFYFNLSIGLQPALAAQSLDLVLLPVGPAQDPFDYLVSIVDRHIADAYVITNVARVDPRVDLLAEREVPFVALGRGGSAVKHSWFDLDFDTVARDSVARLTAAGHTRIAMAADNSDVNSTQEYERGFRSALEKRGLQPHSEIRVPDTPHGGAQLAERLLEMPEAPTAVMLAQETLALGLYRRLEQAGVRAGRDLAVIGFRKNPVCEFLTPALTSFEVSLPAYGRRLAEIVLDRLSATDEPVGEIWPMTIAPGDSDAAPPRVHDRLIPE